MSKKPSSLALALVLIAAVGVSTAVAQLGLRNDGIEFPDGSVQTSAAKTAGDSVQGSLNLDILDLDECAEGTIYTVPAGKRLRIEWINVEIREFAGDDFDPVDIDIKTWLANVQVTHFLDRIDGSQVVGTSFFRTVRFSTPATLYSQGPKTLDARACRSNDTDVTTAAIRFYGQLFDE